MRSHPTELSPIPRSRGLRARALLATVSVLALIPPALADPVADSTAIPEIVVTAQRRDENLQSVPLSTIALNQDALTSGGFLGIDDLPAMVPSLQITENAGRFEPIITIRGINSSDYSPNQLSPIGVYADEAYIPETFLHGANFFDAERVEVLMGPQGTLYGKNTTGGAINLISRTPDLNGSFAGNLTVGYGNNDAVTLDGGLQDALVPGKLAFRLAVKGETVTTLAGFYRKVWALGQAGVEVPLTLYREGVTFDVRVNSSERAKFLKTPRMH